MHSATCIHVHEDDTVTAELESDKSVRIEIDQPIGSYLRLWLTPDAAARLGLRLTELTAPAPVEIDHAQRYADEHAGEFAASEPGKLLDKIELAFLANNGRDRAKNCECEPEVGATPCRWCAIDAALSAAKRFAETANPNAPLPLTPADIDALRIEHTKKALDFVYASLNRTHET